MSAVSTLGARVTALERQVAALRGRAGGGEQLSANYLTANPDGTVGANFTGRIHAQGLDLDVATSSTPPSVDVVRWLRTDTGGLVAHIQAYYTGATGGSSAAMVVQAQGTTDTTAALLEVLDDTGASQALLQATQINRGAMPNPASTGGNTEVDVFAANGAQAARLLGADGSSHFLQQPTATNLKIQAGTGTFLGNGTAAVNPATTIDTDLTSIVATAACPAPNPVWGGYLSCVRTAPVGSFESITFAANTNGTYASGTTYHFFWIAIG